MEGTGDHDLGIARIHRDGRVSELPLGVRLVRRDVGPCARARVQLPESAVQHRHGTGIGAVADEEISVGGQDRVVGTVLAWLSGYHLPGGATVVAAIQPGFAHDRYTREDRLAGLALAAARRIEEYEDDSAAASAAPGGQLGFLGRQLQHVAGKALDLVPGHRAIHALPQTILACAEEEDAAIVGIHGHALAVAATGFVATELDGQVGALEGAALIGRAQDGTIGNLRRGVGAAGQIHLARIRRIHRDALHAHEIQVGIGNPVEDRFPFSGLGISAVGAPYVRAGVADVLGGGMKHEPVHETATDDLDALPGVGKRSRFLRGNRRGRLASASIPSAKRTILMLFIASTEHKSSGSGSAQHWLRQGRICYAGPNGVANMRREQTEARPRCRLNLLIEERRRRWLAARSRSAG